MVTREQRRKQPADVITAVLACPDCGRPSVRLHICRILLVPFELRDRPSRAGRNGHRTDCGQATGRAWRRIRVADSSATDDTLQRLPALRSHTAVLRRPAHALRNAHPLLCPHLQAPILAILRSATGHCLLLLSLPPYHNVRCRFYHPLCPSRWPGAGLVSDGVSPLLFGLHAVLVEWRV